MRHITLRILAGFLLIAAIAGIGVLAYNAGATHGQLSAVQVAAPQTGGPAYPLYWWPFPFLGFGFFGLLAVFFLISLAFGALRMILWGPRWGWRRWHQGYWGERGEGEEAPIPPMMAELHRRMHAADEGKPAGSATQK